MLRDDHNVVLGVGKGRHTSIVRHVARPGIIGGEAVDDIAVEHVQHLREVARAAGDLQVCLLYTSRCV